MPRNDRPITDLALLTVVFLALGVAYMFATPIFEPPDEINHYPVVQHIATTGTLPVQRPGVETLWEQEGSQPPLYYLIGAGLTGWIDTSDLPELRQRNPHAKFGIPLDPDNRAIAVHTPAEAFPWRGSVLAVYLLRAFGLLLGAGTVALTYLLAATLWPDRRWMPHLAAALVAFNPMFLFISASVNNDNLMNLLGAWVLLVVVRLLKDGITTRRAATLAVLAGLLPITKISGLTFLPLIGLALLWRAWRHGEWRQALLAGLAVAVAVEALAAWWYVRNLRLYGEPLGIRTMIAIVGAREPLTIHSIGTEWYGFWVSYWALFGSVNILMDPIVYHFLMILTAVSVLGLGWWVIRTARRGEWTALVLPGALALQIIVTFAGLLRWTSMTYASQGRLMFPTIAALSTLMALGLLNWLQPRWHPAASAAAVLPLLAVAVLAPIRSIAPAYAPPPTVSELPPEARPIALQFGDLEIVAIRPDYAAVQPGELLPFTLYLRANAPLDQDLSIYAHAIGRDGAQIGKVDMYPGGGNLPTTQMEPGLLYADRTAVRLDEAFVAPVGVQLSVGAGIFRGGEYRILTEGRMPDGSAAANVTRFAGAAYPADPADCAPPNPDAALADIGGFARLWVPSRTTRATAGDQLPVTLVWDSTAYTPVDWTVFVHLINSHGEMVAQADAPPMGGQFPTSLWRQSCAFEDIHVLILPADLPLGEYTIRVGMYDATEPTYARASAAAPDGTPYPDNTVPAVALEIVAP